MIDVFRLGKVGHGEQVLRLEIGDDDGGAVLQYLLGLGGDVAVGGQDVLDEIVFLAEELAALVVVLDGDARAGDAVVGDDGIDQRERHRLVIGLAEIMDDDLDHRRRPRRGRRGWLGVVGSARAIGDQREEGSERDDDRREAAAPHGNQALGKDRGRNRNLQLGHLSKMDRPNHPSSDFTHAFASGRCLGGLDGERRLAHGVLEALPILASKRARKGRDNPGYHCRLFPSGVTTRGAEPRMNPARSERRPAAFTTA